MSRERFFLILIISILLLSSFVSAANLESEDLAIIKAKVLDFSRDESNNNAMISLKIDEVLSYTYNEDGKYDVIKAGDVVMYGFLWGHKQATFNEVPLERGDNILANVGYHYNFTSHSGHLYNYQLICNPDEINIDGFCIPSECVPGQHVVDNKCVKLVCDDDETIINHECVRLICAGDENAINHECILLECNENQHAINHSCISLNCEDDEEVVNNQCSKLSCGLFRKPRSNKCVINVGLLGIILLVGSILIYFLYEEYASKIRKTKFYKMLEKNDFYFNYFIIIIAIISLLTPLTIRFFSNDPVLMGQEAYYHAELSRQIMNNEFSGKIFDSDFNIYHLLIAGLGEITGVYIASLIIPIMLGIFSIIILINLSKKFKMNTLARRIFLLIFFLSPGFIYLFSFSSPHSLAVFLTLAGTYLLTKNKKYSVFKGSFLLLIASSFSLFNSLLCFAILIFIADKKKKNKHHIFISLFIIMAASLPYHIIGFEPRTTIELFRTNILKESITSFGALIGFSIFSIFLSIFGFISTWKKKDQYALFYLLITLLSFGVYLLNQNYNMYGNFVLVYLSSLGIVYLLKSKWELDSVKELTTLIIVCGLIFSTVLYAKQIGEVNPNQDLIEGLTWLKEQEDGKVLSHYSRGHWIGFVSDKEVFTNSLYDVQTNMKLNLSDEIFYSRDLIKTRNILDEQNIDYIFIDKEMKRGIVWTKEEQGLLFLFRNKENFKKIYSNQGVEIWQIIRD